MSLTRLFFIFLVLVSVEANLRPATPYAADSEPASTVQKAEDPDDDLAKFPQLQKLWEKSVEENEGVVKGASSGNLSPNDLGRDAINAARSDLTAFIAADQEISKTHKLAVFAKDFVLDHISPSKMGHWIVNTAKTRGMPVAIAFAVSNLSDLVLLAVAAAHPHLAPLMFGIIASPLGEMVCYPVAFAYPALRERYKLWNRNGGLFKGAFAYYEKLIARRKLNPIDWGKALGKIEIPGYPSLKAVVQDRGWFHRQLPDAVRVFTHPDHLALEKSAPAIDLNELEDIAKQANENAVSSLKQLKKKTSLYVKSLLLTIQDHSEASKSLEDLIKKKNEKFPDFWQNLKPGANLDAVLDDEALFHEGVQAIASEARARGEPVEAVAERLYWSLGERLDNLQADAFELKKIPKTVSQSIKDLKKLLNPGASLDHYATQIGTPQDESNYEKVLLEARSIAEQLTKTEKLVEDLATPPVVRTEPEVTRCLLDEAII